MKSHKIGLLGAGFIADHHIYALSLLPNVEIQYIYSRSSKNAKKLVDKYQLDAQIEDDYNNIISGDCDIIDICLPNILHEETAIKALNAGKHIFIEKPLARTVAEGKAILNAAKQNERRVFYCENNLYAPAFVKMKQIIEQGALGKIFGGRGREQHSGPHSPWFYQKEAAGGGALIDLGVHDVACIKWFLQDKIEKVYCQTQIVQLDRGEFGQNEVEDYALGILYFQNGAQITIEESWASPGGYQILFELYGTEGQIVADPARKSPISVYSDEGYGYAVEKASTTQGWTHPIPQEAWTFGYPQEMEHFIKCLDLEIKARTEGDFGLEILRILEAMYESAKTGQIISLI